MTAEQLLTDLRSRGVSVDLEGEDLHVRGELSDQDRVTLRHLKPEVVELLRAERRPEPSGRSRTRSAPSSSSATRVVGRPPDPQRSERARQLPRGPGGRFSAAAPPGGAPDPEPLSEPEPGPADQPRRRGFLARLMWGDVLRGDE